MCYLALLRVCVCVFLYILEHIHLLREVVAEQTVEATQVGLPGEVQPHDLAQVPVEIISTHLARPTSSPSPRELRVLG